MIETTILVCDKCKNPFGFISFEDWEDLTLHQQLCNICMQKLLSNTKEANSQ